MPKESLDWTWRTRAQKAEAANEQLRAALQHLVNKSNRVTASERHGSTISKADFATLYDAQLAAEAALKESK